MVLRGVDPFSSFFVSAHYKRAALEAFDEKSGERVGCFSADTEDLSPGTRLALSGRAVGSRAPGMPVPVTELSLVWRAPTLAERAAPGALPLKGPIVFKATMARDPLTVRWPGTPSR